MVTSGCGCAGPMGPSSMFSNSRDVGIFGGFGGSICAKSYTWIVRWMGMAYLIKCGLRARFVHSWAFVIVDIVPDVLVFCQNSLPGTMKPSYLTQASYFGAAEYRWIRSGAGSVPAFRC